MSTASFSTPAVRAFPARLAAAAALLLALTAGASLRNGMLADPVLLWTESVASHPGKARPYLELGLAYHQRLDYGNALRYYLRSLAIDPYYSVNQYRNLGFLYLDTGDNGRAVQTFTLALSLDANDPSLYSARGLAALRMRDYGSSLADYGTAVGMAPRDAALRKARAAAYRESGREREARTDLEEACRLGAQDACAGSAGK